MGFFVDRRCVIKNGDTWVERHNGTITTQPWELERGKVGWIRSY